MIVGVTRVLCVFLFALTASAQSAREVAVVRACLQWGTGIDYSIIHFGEFTASKIFDQIGVSLRWSCDPKGIARTIRIRFVENAGPGNARDTLAYALPYAKRGVQIYVFNDRLRPFFDRDTSVAGRFLGHVLAHEIGHVLSGVAAHSRDGLMRARWTPEDFMYMRIHLLKFANEDRQLIRLNLSRAVLHAAAD